LKDEKLTKKEIIDDRLKEAGWNVGDSNQVVKEIDIKLNSNMVQEAGASYAGRQFSDLLGNFILEKGELQKRNLIETPFTFIHSQIIRGVFSPADIKEILIFTEKLIAS